MNYSTYETAATATALQTQPVMTGVSSVTATRKSRRSRKMRTLCTVGLISMFMLGFGSGLSAFANDDADVRMPLIAEYEQVVTPVQAAPADEATIGTVASSEAVPSPTVPEQPAATTAPATPRDETIQSAPQQVSYAAAASEPQAQAEAEAPTAAPAAAPAPAEEPLAPCTLNVNGTRVPYAHMIFAPACPDDNAALWAGNDDTTDGSFGYFVGHNPGDFACVYNLVEGDHVTLCDANGNTRDYTVSRIHVVPNTTYFQEVQEKLIPGGECLVMQTCIGDGSYYRVVICD